FRGETVIPASLRLVLAVLHDQKHKKEWMENCVENRVLRYFAPGKVVLYNRIGSPFPLISDRDVVVRTKLDIHKDERRVRIEGEDTKDDNGPPVDGVVRMARLQVSWDLTALDASSTHAVYQVQADPGGALPMWL